MWSGPDHVNPDQTYFADEYLHHVLYITRIYFLYGTAERELIGTYTVMHRIALGNTAAAHRLRVRIVQAGEYGAMRPREWVRCN